MADNESMVTKKQMLLKLEWWYRSLGRAVEDEFVFLAIRNLIERSGGGEQGEREECAYFELSPHGWGLCHKFKISPPLKPTPDIIERSDDKELK